MDKHSPDLNLSEAMEENHSFLDMELEALQSIYINEIEVKSSGKATAVSIDLHPSTADKLEEQYVRMTLQFTLDEGYPDVIPVIKIRNPRGLSDEKLNCIIKDLSAIAENKRGSSMLFEMIEAAKDHLTTGNRPSGECAICLYGFSENDVFTKTECYHYFHSHCLARYAKNFKENSEDYKVDPKSKAISNELLCPMCRVPIQFNGCEEKYPPPESGDDTDFAPSQELVELQQKMAELYQKQIEKGGIIDVEAEKNKYLLEISNVPTRINVEEKTDQKVVADGESTAECKTETDDLVSSPNKERKTQTRDRNQRFDYKGRNKNSFRQDDRRNYRYNQGFNRQHYNNYGNYNKNNYKKQSFNKFEKPYQSGSIKNEVPELPHSATENSVTASDLENTEKKDTSTDCVQDDKSEASEQQSPERRRFNHQNKYSDSRPRYNRGYRQGNYYGNNSSYNENRRSDRSGFQESDSQTHHRIDYRSEERDYDPRKGNNRNGSFKRDDFYSRDKYSERSSHRGYRGGFGRRENYSYEHNNDFRKNRYEDRDQYYAERDRSFKDKRTPRDGRYRDTGDSYGYNRKGFKNYAENKFEKHSNESQNTVPENCESIDLSSSRSQNSDSNNRPIGDETLTNAHGSGDHKKLPCVNDDAFKKDIPQDAEQCSSTLTDKTSSLVECGLNTLGLSESLQCNSRTALNPPPGFANPLKKVIYGLQGANPPPGFQRS